MAGLTALIPLDGSKLAESAFSLLPFIKQLGFDRVQLVSAWEKAWPQGEPIPAPSVSELEEADEKGRNYLDAYLQVHAQAVRDMGFDVEIEARVGRVPNEILAAAEGVDLVLMATHGREGIARWRLGSVADKVIREAPCPVLLIGPNVSIELGSYRVRRIVVPVDGSELGEQMLPLARWIAGLTGAEVTLTRAISPTPIAIDGTMGLYSADLLGAMEESGKVYLDRIAQSLAPVKTTTVLLLGSAVEQLLDYMQENPPELVIMATHARSGVFRAALGSVTDRLLHGPAPVLVDHPEREIKSRLLEAAENARTA
jgi:nucleotide-binding universal stress UspA family protein